MGSDGRFVVADDIAVNVWSDVEEYERLFVDVQVDADVVVRLCDEPADGRPVVEFATDSTMRSPLRIDLRAFEQALQTAKATLLGEDAV